MLANAENLFVNAEEASSIPGSGRSPGERNGDPLQYSWLVNLMERGDCQATVHGVARVGYDLETKQQQRRIETELPCLH